MHSHRNKETKNEEDEMEVEDINNITNNIDNKDGGSVELTANTVFSTT